MSILNKLQSQGSTLSNLNGTTPNKMKSAEGTSHVMGQNQHTKGHTQLEPGTFVKYTDNLPR
ncbi:hypothetical protein N9Z41_00330 [bacterium]|nr:hypothetical protein [bacterium]